MCFFLAVQINLSVELTEEEYMDVYEDNDSTASRKLKEKILNNVWFISFIWKSCNVITSLNY